MNRIDFRILIHHPDLIRYSIKDLIRKRIHLRWSYWVEQRQCNTRPRIISIRLNSPDAPELMINSQFGSFGSAPGKGHRKEGEYSLSSEKLKRIIDEVDVMQAELFLWGNDPFLYPDITTILEYVRERKIYCRISTRGTGLGKLAETLVALGTNEISVSIDGPKQVYKNINSRSDDYDSMESGVKELVRWKKEKKQKKPLLVGNMVITAENYHYLEESLAFAEEMGFEAFTFNYTFFVTESMGQSHNRFFLDTFNSPADSWEKQKIDVSGIEVAALIRDIMRLQKRASKVPLFFFPYLKSWQITDFYKTPDFSAGIDRCKIPWYVFNLLENGRVVPCIDYPDFVVGNLQDDTVLTCWNNDDMRQFRTELIRFAKFPICSKCSGLYML